MGDEKKPALAAEERDSGEKEKLGPYLLHEHLPQERYDQGELYLATHATKHTRTLVLKPGAQAPREEPPLGAWEGRVISSDAPEYLALEVYSTRCARTPKRPSLEELMTTFEQMRAGMERMARLYFNDEPLSPKQRRRRVLAGAAGGALLFTLAVAGALLASPAADADAGTHASPEALSCQVPAQEVDADVFTRGSPAPLAPEPMLARRPVPFAPLKGQKRPPCTPKSQVELFGGCWAPHEMKAPCPNDLFEHEGKCYIPIYPPEAPPSAGDN